MADPRSSFVGLLQAVSQPLRPKAQELLRAVVFKGEADSIGDAGVVQAHLDTHAALTTTAHGGIVASTDSRLTDARPASDVYAWAKAATKPTYTYSEVGADAAGAAAAITPTTLGLVIGTNTEAWSAKLDSYAGLAAAAGWLHNDGAGALAWSTPGYAAVGAEPAGAVATHAALTTGVHGLAITAGQTLTVTTGGTIGSAAYTASSAYDAAGVAAGAVSTHAALTTGIHGLAITAGQTLTVTTGGTLGSAAYTASTAYDASGAASTVQGNLNTHAGLSTTAHGGIVASTDSRLSDARAPLAHSATLITSDNIAIARMPTGGAWAVSSLVGLSGNTGADLNLGFIPNGWSSLTHRVGVPYSGNTLVISDNGLLSSGTSGDLDNTAQYGDAIVFNDGGLSFNVVHASAGTNPRTYISRIAVDVAGNVGIGMTGLTYKLDVAGNIRCSTGFGCNGTTPQTAYASGGALAAYSTGVFGYDSSANAQAIHDQVVAIRAALVANGIMS